MHSSRLAHCCFLSLPLLGACNTSDPTSAVLVNQYPLAIDAGTPDSVVVYKGWWSVAQFAEPVAPGAESDPVRVVQGSDYGYALLAPGWDPTSGAPPAALIPVRSANELSVARGDMLSFVVSDAATIGNCAAGEPLAQADADFITQRIFPREFADLGYDAATCAAVPVSGAGGEGGAE